MIPRILFILGITLISSFPAQGEKPHGDGIPMPEQAIYRLGELRWRHPQGSNSSALSADGKRLATTGKTTVAVWDVESGRCVRFIPDCGISDGFSNTKKVALSPDGSIVAHVSEYDHAIRVWDVETGKELYGIGRMPHRPKGGRLPGLGPVSFDAYSSLWFHPNGKELFLATESILSVREPRTGKEIRQMEIPAKPRAFSADGKLFLGMVGDGNTDGVAVICDTRTGKELHRLTLADTKRGSGSHAALSPEGRFLAVVFDRSELSIWDIANRKEMATLTCPNAHHADRGKVDGYTTVEFSTDGRTVFVGSQRGTIYRYDLEKREEQSPLKGHHWYVTGLHHVNGKDQLVSASWDDTVRRWDLTTGKPLPNGDGYTWAVDVARSPDGKLIAVGDLVGQLDLWSAETGQLIKSFPPGEVGINRVIFSPDGKTLFTGHRDGVVRIWDLPEGKLRAELGETVKNDRPSVGEMRFTPDGTRLLVIGRLIGMSLWDLRTRKKLWHRADHFDSRGAFSPDGKVLVTGGWDKQLHFRDPDTGQAYLTIGVPIDQNHPGPKVIVDHVSFSPDGELITTSHHDATIRIWDRRGKELRQLLGHEDTIWSVTFSPDGKWLLSSGVDHTIRIWELATGKVACVLKGHQAWVRTAEFGPRMRTVLSSASVEAYLWQLAPKDLSEEFQADLAARWEELKSAEASNAYRAIWAFANNPKEASQFLRAKIRPIRAQIDEKKVNRLIKDLDSPRFAVRERAMQSLAEMGSAIRPMLAEALKISESLEVRERLTALIDQLNEKPGPEDRRRMRAVQALELARTDEARAVLKEWAKGASYAPLTEDARAALKRLRE